MDLLNWFNRQNTRKPTKHVGIKIHPQIKTANNSYRSLINFGKRRLQIFILHLKQSEQIKNNEIKINDVNIMVSTVSVMWS